MLTSFESEPNFYQYNKINRNGKKTNFSIAVVDDELAGPLLENDASDSALAPARPADLLRREAPGQPGLDVLLQVRGTEFFRRRLGESGRGGSGGSGGGDCERPGFGRREARRTGLSGWEREGKGVGGCGGKVGGEGEGGEVGAE